MQHWALYNEIDEYAADWLENLIEHGAIAPGVVDRRSIEDILVDDLRGFRQVHFFAGIGVWSYALRRAGVSDDTPVWTGSCPCQPFSAAGKGGGVDDERHLWPAWYHLIRQYRPALIFGEQVASADGLGWLDAVSADLEAAGYTFGAVDTCSAGSGAAHIRQRLRLVAHLERSNPSQPNNPGCTTGRMGDGDHARLEGFSGRYSSAIERLRALRPAPASSQLGRLDDTHGAAAEHAIPAGRDLHVSPSAVGGVAYTQHYERGTDFTGWFEEKRAADWGLSPTSRVADADSHGRRETGGSLPTTQRNGLAGNLTVGGVADTTHRTGLGEESRSAQRVVSEGAGTLQAPPDRPRPTNGFWADADWLFCRDERWRPIEPGTFPLAHGATSRVGRLRAYGNAVDAEATKDFIEAYLTRNQKDLDLAPASYRREHGPSQFADLI